jgi:hypothetical protein
VSPNRRAILTRSVAGRVLIPVLRRWGGLLPDGIRHVDLRVFLAGETAGA